MVDQPGLPGEEVHVLTWLDDLFDTRISTMFRYDMEKAIKLIPQGYDIRTCDNFIWEGLGVTKEAWLHMWNNRDDEILVNSVRSAVPDFIRELLGEHIRQPARPGKQSPITVTINIYPYYLTDEVKDGLVEAYREMIHPMLDVRFIRKSYKDLSPAFVIAKYTMVIHYDYDVWLAEAAQSPERANMTTLNVIGPRIWKDAPSAEEQEKYKKELEHFDIHMLAEMATALVFQLNLVPVDLWVAYKTNHRFSQETKDILFPDAAGQAPASMPEKI